MNQITNYERVVSEIPKGLKRSLVASIKRDKLSLSQAIKRMIILYVNGEIAIAKKGKFDL